MARSSKLYCALPVLAVLFLTDVVMTHGSEGIHFDPNDTSTADTVKMNVGHPVLLSCNLPRIGNDSDNKVSWVRPLPHGVLLEHNRDWAFDVPRYRSYCMLFSDRCSLTIKKAQKDDSGFYQAVVNSQPPKRCTVYLSVFESVTTILGEPSRVIQQGSSINLTCVVQPTPATDYVLTWMRNGVVISGSGFNVTTIKEKDALRSYLLLQDAQPKHSGTYTCIYPGYEDKTNDSVVIQVQGALTTPGNSEDINFEPIGTSIADFVKMNVGHDVSLQCHLLDIGNLPDNEDLPDIGNHSVYWVRPQAENIITHYRYHRVYDGRYIASCSDAYDRCWLIIKETRKDDSGFYQAVVNTEPPTRCTLYLSVFESAPKILGEHSRVVLQGSSINLTCTIQPKPIVPYTMWLQHNGEIPLDDRELYQRKIEEMDAVTLNAQIRDAQPKHSGTYTCKYSENYVDWRNDSVIIEVTQAAAEGGLPSSGAD